MKSGYFYLIILFLLETVIVPDSPKIESHAVCVCVCACFVLFYCIVVSKTIN